MVMADHFGFGVVVLVQTTCVTNSASENGFTPELKTRDALSLLKRKLME